MKKAILGSAVAAMVGSISAEAAAAYCGQWFMGNGGRDLVIGVASDGSGNPLSSGGHPYLALCERNGGTLTYQGYQQSCTDTSEGAGDFIMIYGGTGDDRIGPLRTGYEISCGTGNYIMPFSSWRVPMWAYGNLGLDKIYGTEGGDGLTSSDTSFTADNSNDVLCGFGGDDLLVGDYDFDVGTGFHECMDGGGGTNACYGVKGVGASSDVYVSGTCATAVDVVTGSCACAASDANFW